MTQTLVPDAGALAADSPPRAEPPVVRLNVAQAWTRAVQIVTDRYLSLDLRVLALFRVVFGAVLLCDTLIRFTEAPLFYSNSGALSNHYILFQPANPYFFSAFLPFSTPLEVRLAIGGLAFVDLAFMLGWRTRTMQVLALLLHTSLNARNPLVEDGGIVTMGIVLAWTAPMPLGARFSLDAYRTGARNAATRFTSILVLGITLQLACIYLFNSIQKTGGTWHHGDAIHFFMRQNRIATPLAGWLRLHEPAWFSPLATRSTLVVESLLPLLIVSPFAQRYCRALGVALAVGLHMGIAMLSTIGCFSYVMVAANLLMLPPEVLERAGGLLAALVRRGRPVDRREKLEVRGCLRRGLQPMTVARESGALILLFAIGLQITKDNPACPQALRVAMPASLAPLIEYPRLLQGWRMFAPDAPTEDGALVIDATTRDGRHVDPLTGAEPDFDAPLGAPAGRGSLSCNYAARIASSRYAAYRAELGRFVRDWSGAGPGRDARPIVAFKAWWGHAASPVPGSLIHGTPQRELIFDWRRD
jgi:hypothetical protein